MSPGRIIAVATVLCFLLGLFSPVHSGCKFVFCFADRSTNTIQLLTVFVHFQGVHVGATAAVRVTVGGRCPSSSSKATGSRRPWRTAASRPSCKTLACETIKTAVLLPPSWRWHLNVIATSVPYRAVQWFSIKYQKRVVFFWYSTTLHSLHILLDTILFKVPVRLNCIVELTSVT